MRQAIILSGGKGTRLRPLTYYTPKPILPIGGIPHLEYQINLLTKYQNDNIIISTGYLHKKIVDYFGDGSRFGVNITYREDGDMPLGTAGAVKNCEDLIEANEVLVLNGDILTNINLDMMYEKHKQGITMALASVDDPTSFGVAQLNQDNNIIKFIEKPKDGSYGNKINAGIYLLDREVIDTIPSDTYWMFETNVFDDYIKKDKLYGHIDDFYWLDIGTHERYIQANEDVSEGRFRL